MIRTLQQSMRARPLLQRWAARLGLGVPALDLSPLSAAILATQSSNLMGYYPCDDASGSLTDLSDNGNDLAAQGTGHTYSVTGQVGDAVRGNLTGGWNNDGVQDAGVSFLPGDNGFTMMALVKSAGLSLQLSVNRFLGCGPPDSQGGNIQLYYAHMSQARNRSVQTIGAAVSSSTINVLQTDYLPDNTDWHHLVFRCFPNGASGTLDTFMDNIETSPLATTTWNTGPSNILGCLCINSLVNSGAGDRSVYGSMLLQHVAFWDADLTDSEITVIFDETGL